MKFIDFFAGIGGFHTGLTNSGMTCVGWCEYDKFAIKSYKEIYDTKDIPHYEDIREIKGGGLPQADLWSFGFPCQDISIAGYQKGVREGTRSGLFFEVMRLLDEREEDKPQWLLIENVRNLLSVNKGWDFFTVTREMASRGYFVEWKLYNSKDYGVPQNRERIYIVGYYGNKPAEQVLPICRKSESSLIQVVNGPQANRVYNSKGTSCTLTLSSQGNYLVSDSETETAVPNTQQETSTVDPGVMPGKVDPGEAPEAETVLIRNGTKQGYLEAEVGDGIDLQFPESTIRRGRVQPQRSNTLTTSCNLGVLTQKKPIQIRKLTPLECWRLQGFTDDQYNKAKAVNSETQLYRQAANSVTVPLVEYIGRHIFNINNSLNQET